MSRVALGAGIPGEFLSHCLVVLFQRYNELKEGLLERALGEWGLTVESFVECCEGALKKLNDPRADRILGNILEFTDFTQFAEMMEKRNVDLQARSFPISECFLVSARLSLSAVVYHRPAILALTTVPSPLMGWTRSGLRQVLVVPSMAIMMWSCLSRTPRSDPRNGSSR